ncbi:hypothetical protein [Gallaecimonas sp. GXIMD4217]|uniref:hypothetical protein n=1 Tax=Gallaecimonas sp. GXIMD4217 TaxID=3131927 RepID=UPI00311AEC30
MKNFIKIAMVILLIVSLPSLINQLLEKRYTNAESFVDLKESYLAEYNWFPDYFPKDATKIYVYHNVEESSLNVDFTFDPLIKRALGTCSIISENDKSKKYICDSKFEYTEILRLSNDGQGKFIMVYNGI